MLYSVDENSGNISLLAGATMYADNPIGSILSYGGANAPSGWFLCQGQALSRTAYSELFAVIGTSFGAGDGSTTFNLPDLRGEFLRGAGTNSHTGQGSGSSVGAHQDSTTVPCLTSYPPNRNMYIGGESVSVDNSDSFFGYANNIAYFNYDAFVDGTGQFVSYKASIRPTNTSVNYIIKAKQVGVPADFMSYLQSLENKMSHIGDRYASAEISPDTVGAWAMQTFTFSTQVPAGKYFIGGRMNVVTPPASMTWCGMYDIIQCQYDNVNIPTLTEVVSPNVVTINSATTTYSWNVAGDGSQKFKLILVRIG